MERSPWSEKEHPVSEPQHGRGALGLGGLATILASICCLGPLVLVAIGVSGAWIGNLTVLEPYRPSFFGAALVAFFFAYWRIFRPAQACKPGEVCAVPQVKTAYKIIFGIVAALTGIALAFPSILAPLLLSSNPTSRLSCLRFFVEQQGGRKECDRNGDHRDH